MPKGTGLGQNLYIAGRDLSGDVGVIDRAGSPRGDLNVNGLDRSAVERLLLRTDGLLNFHSWFNDAALAEHSILSTLPTIDVICSWLFGTAIGDVAAGIVAKQINYDPSRGADGSLAMAINMLANRTPLEWGTSLTAGKITHASATDGASEDNLGATADGLAAYLQLFDLASGTVTVEVQDSADDIAFLTIISFAAVADGAEPATERLTVAGAVRQHLRVRTTGTFTNAQFNVITRRGESVDDEAYA